jgi:hypothetical protein
MFLILREASSVAKTPSYVTYLNSDLVIIQQRFHRTLIPAITGINKSTGARSGFTSEMMCQSFFR